MIDLALILEIMNHGQAVYCSLASLPLDLQRTFLSNQVLQAYMVCKLEEKVDVLWSFLKTHLKVGHTFVPKCLTQVNATISEQSVSNVSNYCKAVEAA